MALVFYANGTSFNAIYSNGGNIGDKFNSGIITTGAGGLSGTLWDLTNTSGVKFVSFSGARNTPNGRITSIITRLAPSYTGTPAGTRAIWSLSSGVGTSSAYLELRHDVTTGNVTIVGKNETAATFVSGSFGAWSPTSGTLYDLVIKFNGTTTASDVKCFIDNVQLGTGLTATNALLSSWTNTMWKSIDLGCAPNTTASAYKLDEFGIDDTYINTASYPLVGGNGALNGASRIHLLAATALNGDSYTDPGVANVRNTTSYTYAGTTLTGTAAIPVASDVRLGTAIDATTGTLAVPAASKVLLGVAVDNTTGTLPPAKLTIFGPKIT